jgi:hypothetical protein
MFKILLNKAKMQINLIKILNTDATLKKIYLNKIGVFKFIKTRLSVVLGFKSLIESKTLKKNLHQRITMENITRLCRTDKSFHFSPKIFSIQI